MPSDQVIVFGFEPFPPHEYNPTKDLVEVLNGQVLRCGLRVVGVVLPSSYERGPSVALEAIEEYQPQAVLGLGLSSSLWQLRLESRGRNWKEHTGPDADGVTFQGQVIDFDGDDFYEVPADVPSLVLALKSRGIPVTQSRDANAFICNALIYQVMQMILRIGIDLPFAYLHTPYTDYYTGRVELPPEKRMIPAGDLSRAVELILEELCR
jgi:pyroglutamyl-peptidase